MQFKVEIVDVTVKTREVLIEDQCPHCGHNLAGDDGLRCYQMGDEWVNGRLFNGPLEDLKTGEYRYGGIAENEDKDIHDGNGDRYYWTELRCGSCMQSLVEGKIVEDEESVGHVDE